MDFFDGVETTKKGLFNILVQNVKSDRL